MIDNNSSELLFHVERAASGGWQDVSSMAAMTIFWNINYCVELLDEMISYCRKSENVLAINLMILLSSVEIIAVSWLWSILHIAIFMPMCWLEASMHKVKEYGWGYISMGKVLDKIKYDLSMIVDQPELIHDESFMMGMMDPWNSELPTFQEYLDHKLKQHKTNYFNSTPTTKAVPIKELHKEMVSPTYQYNKYITQMLEELGVVSETRWVQELLHPKKATCSLMSESRAQCSWYVLTDDLKEALLGFMAVNDLAESSLAGVTDQLQVFG